MVELGIFWIVDGKVLKESKPFLKVKSQEGIRDLDVSHYEIWENRFKMDIQMEYELSLRGRILMLENHQILIISCQQFMKSLTLQEKVITSFHLSGSNYRITTDLHYEHPSGKEYLPFGS
jgi:hypothetical protein